MHICSETCPPVCGDKGRPVMGGCNHVTCKCGHEWCWMCYKPWSEHGGGGIGGGYVEEKVAHE